MELTELAGRLRPISTGLPGEKGGGYQNGLQQGGNEVDPIQACMRF